MREILFRGKEFKTPHDEYDMGWVYGFYCSNSGAHFITHVVEPDSGGCYFSDILVDPETVGQFTGLLDKNSKRIYEGDIVRDNYGNIRAVKFFNGRYCPFIAYPEYKCWNEDECEIIGNIHDNPELLEVK